MDFTRAITRTPGRNFAQGITSANLGAPEYGLMLAQHQAYVQALRDLGLEVTVLPPLPDYPDAHFVEDVAVVTAEVAVITSPGAPARQGEQAFIEPVLAQYRPLARIEPPGTMEGGDILIMGKQVFIGISERTNHAGAQQLGQILGVYGYNWTPVPLAAGLHLKSSVNAVGAGTLLVTRDFADHPLFAAYARVLVDPAEEYAANCLFVNEHLIVPSGFPATQRALQRLDCPIIELQASEAQKMDGGLTCMSLRF